MEALRNEGLEVVLPGSLSVRQQVKTFRSASLVIGPHGAGLSNIVFCRPGTRIYELHSSHYINPCINRLALASGHRYEAEVFEGAGEGNEHQMSWAVDILGVVRRIREIRREMALSQAMSVPRRP